MAKLLANWPAARLLRLVLAVLFAGAALREGEPIAWVAAALLGVQAVFNMGCCGTACAAPPVNRKGRQAVDEIHYEEVS